MHKVLIPTKLDKFAADMLTQKGYEVILDASAPIEEQVAKNSDAEVLIVRSEKVTKEIIDALPKLKLVVRARIEAKNADTISFGVYNEKAKKHVIGKNFPAKPLIGKKYVDIEIGAASFVPGMCYYTGGIYFQRKQPKNPDDKTFVDSLRFEKAD